MDLFRVDRYMGDDEDESGQRDETSRLAQLQRVIADRKRKRQSLGQEENNHVSLNNLEILSSKKLKSDAQEEVSLPKKSEVKKAKHAKEKSNKAKKKRSSEKGTSMDDVTELSVESGISADNSEGIKVTKVTKKEKAKRYKDKGVSKEKSILNPERNSEHEPDDITLEKQDIPEETPEDNNKETGFTVIGGQKKDKEVKKVQRVLPDWLAKPTTINSDFSSNLIPVEKIPYLAAHIIRKLEQHDINHLFPVQSAVIPAILSQMETDSCFGIGGYQPSDICVSAPTGSGKTLAYVLPIVQSLLRRVVCHLRALVILPTKDLANQVKQVFQMFTEGTNLRVGLASGSKSFSKDQEQLVNPRYVLLLLNDSDVTSFQGIR